AGDVFVGTTVLLETEWVQRSAYGFAREDVVRALRGLAGLPGVSVESPTQLAEALQRTQAGMDFADALHLGAASGCEAMLTFDSRFIEAAGSAAIPVIEP
ncbi:MAG: type II toxin-antitoxin system VapC family toxin, partial [Gammaproteobacteria bacterium]|nr:type II toxin-antitoxin system VapC family toxin [Gammaproteobacteria bacterium]